MADSSEVAALIARAQAGDQRAFEQLVAAHIGQIRRFARAFTHSAHDADDLAQEALVKAYRSLRSYRWQAAFSTWLFAITRNAFRDGRRSRAAGEQAREAPLDAADLDRREAPNASPDEGLLREEERRRVWSAIREVPEELRAVLVLFDIEGLPYHEIAAIERVPVGTVKSRLHRGRGHLYRALGGVVKPGSAATMSPADGNLVVPSLVAPKKGA